ncbi:CPBP family intramembrane glutamic endopeptidase [Shewanella sedimentimangrovi]|uniref:CPBP family intramembrane metalloprotease n=1 Tax=Shewanella sedimentimangrovi TaxID=2814293 RepID=A0ABX7R4P6_9GAMM|nr:CPBP family intramembrane glutamic endopeptidase [Shewanella sedimentimangrovi]QSX38807.1 CPBP family intramembrane metalloprotease [Shewanella sedimentimangrovi]
MPTTDNPSLQANKAWPITAKSIAAREILGFSALVVLSKFALDPVTWRFSAPITLLLSLVILTFYLHRRGESWVALGLRFPDGFKARFMLLPKGLLTTVAIILTGVLVAKTGAWLGFDFMANENQGIVKRLEDVPGNLPMYLLWLGISWLSAGLGEELFFRAFLISRFNRLFEGFRFQRLLSILFPALAFGLVHFYYQGLQGLIIASCIGFTLGALYLKFGRNLLPLIIGHGLMDSLSLTVFYLQLDV